ncbi:MAG: hypothetical protein ACXWMI_02175 [Syntrophales bacterium]
MEKVQSRKMDETSQNNRTHSGEPSGVTDKIGDAPAPGSPGMRILSRYLITADTLMTAVEIACI